MHRLSGPQIGDRIARQFLRIILETSTQELTRPEQAFGAPQTQAVERARIEPQHFIQKTFGFIQNLPVELHSIEIKHQQFGELDPGVEPARSFRKPLYATPQAVNGVGPILEFDLGELTEPLVPRAPIPLLIVTGKDSKSITITLDPRPIRMWTPPATKSGGAQKNNATLNESGAGTGESRS